MEGISNRGVGGAFPRCFAFAVIALATAAWGALASAADGQAAQRAEGSDVRIVSSFVADGEPVPQECREEAYILAKSLSRYPRPESWHWVLLCDEAGWSRFLRLTGREERAAIYASTDLAGRTTYVRGAKLLHPYDLQAGADEVIAHELAHIESRSSNEQVADQLVRRWQSAFRQATR